MKITMTSRALITAATLLLLQALSAGAQPAGSPLPGSAPAGGQMWPARPQVRDAKANELRVIATGSVDAPLRAMQAEAEAAVKWPLIMEFGAARGGLRDQILAGQDFEVAVLMPDVNQELIKLGKALPQIYPVARVLVGIGYRGEGPLPDVSTPAALKKVLLGAKSVTYNPTGAGQPTAAKMLSSLGIADAIKDASKSTFAPSASPAPGPGGAGSPSSGQGGTMGIPLAPGEYGLIISPLSEIISNRNLRSLGPVLAEFQVPVVVEAVIGANAKNEQAAKAFVEFLRSPAFEAALIKNGMVKSQ